eukprot:g7730.t1
MFGRMVYEFNGSACTGFTTSFRLVTKISTGEETRVSDQQTKTFEDLSAGQFHFETKSFTDEQLDKQVTGDASQGDGGVTVELLGQNAQEVQLPPSDFPTSHMLEIIRSAKEQKRFFEKRVFDGSENGDQSLLTSTVIGKAETPPKGDAESGNAGEFAQSPYWPVTIAYFNDAARGDPTPVYNMSFKLYENGITRDLTMDYGDFSLSGSLVKLELLKKQQDPCPAAASELIADSAKRSAQYYVNSRWLGGMMTNWKTISNSIARLRKLDEILNSEQSGYSKKERLNLEREREKLEKALGGIRDMGGTPDLMFIIDTNKEKIAIDEAKRLGIPVVAIIDSNCDPDMIDYAIPGNDDASRAIALYCDLVARAAIDGIARQQGASGRDLGASAEAPIEPALEDEANA